MASLTDEPSGQFTRPGGIATPLFGDEGLALWCFSRLLAGGLGASAVSRPVSGAFPGLVRAASPNGRGPCAVGRSKRKLSGTRELGRMMALRWAQPRRQDGEPSGVRLRLAAYQCLVVRRSRRLQSGAAESAF